MSCFVWYIDFTPWYYRHLEITAFLASLSKACSIFSTGIIPPNVNFKNPNPGIRWDEYGLTVPLDQTPLSTPPGVTGLPLISLLSSGIGGSNGHCLLQAPPSRPASPNLPKTNIHDVLLVSGGLSPRTASSVSEDLRTLADEGPSDLRVISAAYGRNSRSMTWRSYAVVSVDSSRTIQFSAPSLAPRVKPPIVYVFSGQGPQHFHSELSFCECYANVFKLTESYLQVGRQLFQDYHVFRESVLLMDDIYHSVTQLSLIRNYGLFQHESSTSLSAEIRDGIWPLTIILPALTILQIALFDLLVSLGLPRAFSVIRHSSGETPMLYAAGVLSREMAVEIAIARGRAMDITAGTGALVAFGCTHEVALRIIGAAQSTLPQAGGVLEIAAYNSPGAVTIGGTEGLVAIAIALAEKEQIFTRRLPTDVPVHSSLMEPCRERYMELVEDVFAKYPTPLLRSDNPLIYSTVTGDLFPEHLDPVYLWRATRSPVLFEGVVQNVLHDVPNATFLEIGAHPALSSYLISMGAAPSSVVCPMRRSRVVRPGDETRALLDCLGRLTVLGYNFIDFAKLNQTKSNHQSLNSPLPRFPFNRRHFHFHPSDSFAAQHQMVMRNGPLNYPNLRISSQTHPLLADHIIRGEPIMPAAGYLEMIFEFGVRTLWDIRFPFMMSIPTDKALEVQVCKNANHSWSVSSKLSGANAVEVGVQTSSIDSAKPLISIHQNPLRLHAEGYMSSDLMDDGDSGIIHLDAIRNRCSDLSSAGAFCVFPNCRRLRLSPS